MLDIQPVVKMISFKDIDCDIHNTRGEGSSTSRVSSNISRKNLRRSIHSSNNLNTPVVVCLDPHGSYTYSLVDGNGREEAWRAEGHKEILCMVVALSECESFIGPNVYNTSDKTKWKHNNWHNMQALKGAFSKGYRLQDVVNAHVNLEIKRDGEMTPEKKLSRMQSLKTLYSQYSQILRVPFVEGLMRSGTINNPPVAAALSKLLQDKLGLLKVLQAQMKGKTSRRDNGSTIPDWERYCSYIEEANTVQGYKKAFNRAFLNKNYADKCLRVSRSSFSLSYMPGKMSGPKEISMFKKRAIVELNSFFQHRQLI
jgi:hypothetical protein